MDSRVRILACVCVLCERTTEVIQPVTRYVMCVFFESRAQVCYRQNGRYIRIDISVDLRVRWAVNRV